MHFLCVHFLGQLNVCYSNFKSKRYEIYPLLYIFLFFFIACKENKTDIIPCVPQTKVDVPLEEVSGISSSFIDTVLFVKLQEPQIHLGILISSRYTVTLYTYLMKACLN